MRTRYVAAFVLTALVWSTWRLVNARSVQTFGRIISRVVTSERVVALTFDDGPEPAATARILLVLAARGVHATFFVEGREVLQHPASARALVEAQHELGNHSFSHPRMIFRSPAFIAREIEQTDAAIRALGVSGPIHFRPPYGKKLLLLPWYLHVHGRTTVTWDLEPESDADLPGDAAAITRRVLQDIRPGSIVLLHVMAAKRAQSLDAVGPIVDGLRARGYRFARVSELVAMATRRPR
jgi:peptidoglycan-N-acetylglucosamine deacetylase